MKLRNIWNLFNSKPIVFDRTEISKDAPCVLASSNHKVPISVIITDVVPESVKFKTTELMITSSASFITIYLQLETERCSMVFSRHRTYVYTNLWMSPSHVTSSSTWELDIRVIMHEIDAHIWKALSCKQLQIAVKAAFASWTIFWGSYSCCSRNLEPCKAKGIGANSQDKKTITCCLRCIFFFNSTCCHPKEHADFCTFESWM